MRFVLDINYIRKELNELPFRDGKREVLVGRITEMFEGESEQATADHLRRCERELRRHTLILTRHEDDSDALWPETRIGRWVQPFSRFFQIQSASGFLLLTCTAIALLPELA